MGGLQHMIFTYTCLRLDGGGEFAPASSKHCPALCAVTMLL